jgi:integrase
MEMYIQAGTTVGSLADAWLRQLRLSGHLENTTVNEYERVLRKLVLPELGTVRLNELTTERINAVLAELGTRSVNRQRKAKVVTGAMLDVAVECGALSSNPARGSISVRRPQTQTRTLTASDLETVRAAVRAWVSKKRSGPKGTRDMADIIDLMLGTGARIGEVLALRWSDVDLNAQRVQIRATIKTETSVGTYRKPLATRRIIELPDFVVATLTRREATARDSLVEAVFPTRNGTWQQVNNVERRWRQIRKDAGLDWVTPDLFRHHVAREA